MAEPTQTSGEELLTRTRRRSNDSHSLHRAEGNGHQGGGSSSWFTWFSPPHDGGGNTLAKGSDSGHRDQIAATSSPLSVQTRQQLVKLLQPVNDGGRDALANDSDSGPRDQIAASPSVEVIRKLVDSYFSIVRKSMLDQVPKAIMHFMVNNTKRGLQQHLIQQLYSYSMTNGLGASQPSLQHAFESMARASGNDSLLDQQLRTTDRSQSMAVAARVATVAVNALQGDMRSMLDVVS
eukprot:gene11576-34275_t